MTIYLYGRSVTDARQARIGWRDIRYWGGAVRAVRRRYPHGRVVVLGVTVQRW